MISIIREVRMDNAHPGSDALNRPSIIREASESLAICEKREMTA
jgi:hypothetical protein